MGDTGKPTTPPSEGHVLPWMRLAGLAVVVVFAVLDAFTPWEPSDRLYLVVLALVLGSTVDPTKLLPGNRKDDSTP